jgi:hypothetical protein
MLAACGAADDGLPGDQSLVACLGKPLAARLNLAGCT